MLASSNFLLPNATFFAELFAFAVVLFVLWKWVVPVVSRAMSERQEQIRASIDEAAQARSEAHETLERYRAELAQARDEARQIVEDARHQAELTRRQLLQRAEQEAGRIIEAAREEAQHEREQVAGQLRADMGALVVELAARVIGEQLDGERQLRLVDAYIEELNGEGGDLAGAAGGGGRAGG